MECAEWTDALCVSIKTLSACLLQTDILEPDLTNIKHIILHSAKRFILNLSIRPKKRMINDILKLLESTDGRLQLVGYECIFLFRLDTNSTVKIKNNSKWVTLRIHSYSFLKGSYNII